MRCRVCHCTYERPCEPPCAWEPKAGDLCTGCAGAVRALAGWLESAYRPSTTALLRELKRTLGATPGPLRVRRKMRRKREAA